MKHRVFLHVVIGLTLLVLLVVACGSPKTAPTDVPLPPTPLPSATSIPPTGTPTSVPPTPTPKPATPTPTPLPSAGTILEDVADAMKDIELFHFDMAMQMSLRDIPDTDDIEIPMTFIGDVQTPDRLQGETSVSVGGMPQRVSMIVIGDTTYVADPQSGEWITTDQPATMFEPGQFTTFDSSQSDDMEYIGEETLAGAPVHHLRGEYILPVDTGEPMGELETAFHADYWITVEDNLVNQVDLAGEVMMPEDVGGSVAITMTARFSEYDAPIVIDAPEVVSVVSLEDQAKAQAIMDAAIDAINQVELVPLRDCGGGQHAWQGRATDGLWRISGT